MSLHEAAGSDVVRAVAMGPLFLVAAQLVVATDLDTARREQLALRAIEARFDQAVASSLDEALVVLGEMERIDPDHPIVISKLVRLYPGRMTEEDIRARLQATASVGPGRTFGEAALLAAARKSADAMKLVEEARRGYEQIGHYAGRAACHSYAAEIKLRQRDLEGAAGEFNLARQIYEELGDPAARGLIAASMAELERARGNKERAAELQHSALSLCEQAGMPWCLGQAWMSIGYLEREKDNHLAARDAFANAMAALRAANSAAFVIVTLRELAVEHRNLGEHSESIEVSREAVLWATDLGDKRESCRARYALGVALASADRTADAVVELEQAVALCEGVSSWWEALALRALGEQLLELGQPSYARDVLERSLVALAHTELANRDRQRFLQDYVDALVAVGEYPEALVQVSLALELLGADAPAASLLDCYGRLSVIYHGLGDLESAIRYAERVIDLATSSGVRAHVANYQAMLGWLLTKAGKNDRALRAFETALDMARDHGWKDLEAQIHFGMADVFWRSGQFARAHQELEAAMVEVRESRSFIREAHIRTRRAKVLREEGRIDEALAEYDKALEIADGHRLDEIATFAYTGRAYALDAAGRLDAAAEAYGKAIDRVEAFRGRVGSDELRMDFLGQRAELYENAMEFAVRRRDEHSAFRAAEHLKSRVLLDVLSEAAVAPRTRLDGETRRRESELVDGVATSASRLAEAWTPEEQFSARDALDRAEQRLRAFEIELHETEPAYAALRYPQPASAAEVQAVLLPNEVLLSYFLGRSQGYVWSISRDAVSWKQLPPTESIATAVAAFVERYGSDTGQVGARPSQDHVLAKEILPPLADRARLLIVPDGPLHHLPFEALRLNGKYLIENHEIEIIPSASALRLLRGRKDSPASTGFLGVARPLADPREEFPDLPYSAQSLERIAGLFPEPAPALLVGEAATERKLRELDLTAYRYVHFATHGWLDADDPRRVGLKLSPVAGDDPEGFLYLPEVFSLELDAEVVMLSACRSGLGELRRGEGLVGLTRAFLYAGAKSVVVALWDVSDRLAAEFSEAFYAELKRGGTPAEALRRTKLSFVRSDRPAQRRPFHWAPFVIVGDSGGGKPVAP